MVAINIGLQAQGYTAARFAMAQIAELLGLSSSASQMNCMLQKLYDDGDISSEYEDTNLLFMMSAGLGAFHTIDKVIRTPADMKGMRILRPSAIGGDIIEATGASPVEIPATDIYTSLQRGVIDGLSLAWALHGCFGDVGYYHPCSIPYYFSFRFLSCLVWCHCGSDGRA